MINTKSLKTLEFSPEISTIRDMIRWTNSQLANHPLFYGHGTDNAWDEANNFVMLALSLDENSLQFSLDCKLTQQEKVNLVSLLERRIKERLPLCYLVNKTYFAGLLFYVDQRVIIPRSPIAELIENHFDPWVCNDKINKVLDLCTGSGCIALAIAAYLGQDVLVDAVDISQDALDVAAINRQKLSLQNQVNLILSDLFTKIPKEQRYDIIISNPPYVSEEVFSKLPTEFSYEPKLALLAENKGLAIVDKILQESAHYLNDKGILIVEVGDSANQLIQAYPDLPFIWLEFERGGEGVFLLRREDLIG